MPSPDYTNTPLRPAKQIHRLLDERAQWYNQPRFIETDPISVPHRFSLPQDIEISGLFAALFAWGNRTTIIAKATELMQRMDNAPWQFVLHASAAELRGLEGFKHRTFTADDLFYFIEFLRMHYQQHASLQTAFSRWMQPADRTVENALNGFRNYFFSLPHLTRTHKHISAPALHSACKRLNMYLRWMVRTDDVGVDFGLWKAIRPAQLVCPLDVHVMRVARHLGLVQQKLPNWQAALELTANLRHLRPTDPAVYDFALFGLGVEERVG